LYVSNLPKFAPGKIAFFKELPSSPLLAAVLYPGIQETGKNNPIPFCNLQKIALFATFCCSNVSSSTPNRPNKNSKIALLKELQMRFFAILCNSLQFFVILCNFLEFFAILCNSLQFFAILLQMQFFTIQTKNRLKSHS